MPNEGEPEPYPRAVVREEDGQLVLDDPDARAVIRALAKESCMKTRDIHLERIEHFKRRMGELGQTPQTVVIVIANMDDELGSVIGDLLMPGTNWDAIRDRGETPFARGLAERGPIEGALLELDQEAYDKLMLTVELAVVVFDHGVAEVFEA